MSQTHSDLMYYYHTHENRQAGGYHTGFDVQYTASTYHIIQATMAIYHHHYQFI